MLLRSFLRLFSSPTPPQPIDPASAHTVIYARVPQSAKADRLNHRSDPNHRSESSHRSESGPSLSTGLPSSSSYGSHRHRLLSMRLEHTRICSPKRCERLAELGIVTAGDLATATPDRLAQHFSARRKAARVLAQYRRAIRLAASVPGMMPLDAMLLISIHRRSVRGLASESAAVLHRDLERFSESSQGRSQLRGRRLPSARRLKRWIAQCESMMLGESMMAASPRPARISSPSA